MIQPMMTALLTLSLALLTMQAAAPGMIGLFGQKARNAVHRAQRQSIRVLDIFLVNPAAVIPPAQNGPPQQPTGN
jgi:hypothetical protein